MDPTYEAALQIIREAKTELQLAGEGRQIFNELKKTLIQYRRRLIPSSTARPTLQILLQNQPKLLKSFKQFFPVKVADVDSAVTSSAVSDCVDFMNRILTRFGNGDVCRRFMECMIAYSSKEISNDKLRGEVVRMFGDNGDLVAEFMCFLTGSDGGERSRKRSLVDDLDKELPPQKRSRKSPKLNSSSYSDDREVSASVPPPWRMRNSGKGGNKEAAKKNVERDYIEEILVDIDVQISNLKSVQVNAENLADWLRLEWISPAEVRLEQWFTLLNLAFIRKIDRKILGAMDKDLAHGMRKLMEILMRKKTCFDKERVKIVEKLIKIRHV